MDIDPNADSPLLPTNNLFQSNKTGFSPNDPITEQPTSGALPGVNDIVGQVGADMANKAVDDFISDFKI